VFRVVPLERVASYDSCINPLEQGIKEGENPVFDTMFVTYGTCFTSRVAWECSSKWVVNSI
jgi:hypothetical protein